MTQSGPTTLGQSGPGYDGNEGVLRIPQISSISGTSLSECLVSYPGPICRNPVGVFYSPSPLGNFQNKLHLRQLKKQITLFTGYIKY